MGTLRAAAARGVPCGGPVAPEGRCRDPGPSYGAAVRRRAVPVAGPGQGGELDAVPTRRHGPAARGRHGGDHDRRPPPAARAHDPELARRDRRPPRRAGGIARRVGPAPGLAGRRRHRPVQYRATPREQGADGGQAIIGDWQEATQFNPYYLTQVTEANVAVGHVGDARDVHRRLQVRARPRRADPDARQRRRQVPGQNGDAMTVTWTLRDGLKWSDGEDLTCDDFKYAWEWVMDPDNVGVVTSGFEDVTAWDCPSPTRDGPPLQERVRGLHHDGRGPAAAPLPVQDPDQGPGQRRAASGPTRSRSCRPAARSSSSPSPRRPSCASHATRTTRAGRPACRRTSTRSCSSGTATPTR